MILAIDPEHSCRHGRHEAPGPLAFVQEQPSRVNNRKRKGAEMPKDPGAAGLAPRNPKLETRNPKLNLQTRKVLRAHYAAKFHAR